MTLIFALFLLLIPLVAFSSTTDFSSTDTETVTNPGSTTLIESSTADLITSTTGTTDSTTSTTGTITSTTDSTTSMTSATDSTTSTTGTITSTTDSATSTTRTSNSTTSTTGTITSTINSTTRTTGANTNATAVITNSTSTVYTSTSSITPTTTPLYPSCSIVTNNVVPNNFQLTVSPDVLSSNSVYTVKVNGSGNATIILQAKSGTSFVGNWSNGNHTCSGGSPLFEMWLDPNNAILFAYWTSPSSLNPVEISAYIKVNDTSKLTKMLTAATTNAPPVTTNKAGSTNRPISVCMDLTKALIMIIITTKLLS
ncbi:uncharacterized protein LOC142106631 [Mixophyes fleayi]|uniref:uncharacterized protein LOC142106631 n=1 Tax=Mixophyes fleayi TaxID=3061075 RepID=UPI003F4DB25E